MKEQSRGNDNPKDDHRGDREESADPLHRAWSGGGEDAGNVDGRQW